MKRNFRKTCIATGLFLAALFAAPGARGNFYEESCQTIRLHGQVQVPPEYKSKRPLELTLAYQMNFQKHPAYLKINLPLGQKDFQITFAGFRKREPTDIYIPMMFWYPRAVKFQYYVKAAEGGWISETRQTTYTPALSRVEEVGACVPDVYLDPLSLRPRAQALGS